jgi:hypothetical protein
VPDNKCIAGGATTTTTTERGGKNWGNNRVDGGAEWSGGNEDDDNKDDDGNKGARACNAGWDANQRAWHNDGLADTHLPPALTTMRCMTATDVGGETLFASSVQAAELLLTEILAGRYGMHLEDMRVRYRIHGE